MAIKVLENERIIMVDIDDTLVMHKDRHLCQRSILIEDPLYEGNTIDLGVNAPMVRLVKEEMSRGSQVVFWSRGGFNWALNVIRALDLDKVADNLSAEIVIMTKPFAYFDDSDVSNWMKDRVYLEPNKPYKE